MWYDIVVWLSCPNCLMPISLRHVALRAIAHEVGTAYTVAPRVRCFADCGTWLRKSRSRRKDGTWVDLCESCQQRRRNGEVSGSNESYRREAVAMAKGFGYELVGQTELNRRRKAGHLVFVNETGHKIAAPSTPRNAGNALRALNQRLRKERTVGEDVRAQFVTWLLDEYEVEDVRENVQIRLMQEAGRFVDERKLRVKPGSVIRELAGGEGDPRIKMVKRNGPKAPFYTLRRAADSNGHAPPQQIRQLQIKVCGVQHPSRPDVTCVLEPNHKRTEAHAGGEDDLHWYDPAPKAATPDPPPEPTPEPEKPTTPEPESEPVLASETATVAPTDVSLTALQTQMRTLFERASRTDEAEAKAALALEELTNIRQQIAAVESLVLSLQTALNAAVETLS